MLHEKQFTCTALAAVEPIFV